MKVLSLFDGISCARVALDRAGIQVEKYYASELDKYAIQVAQKNYPDIIHLGDVRNVSVEQVGAIDLLIGGSPCQDLSIAKKDRKGLEGDKSGLFWEYVRLWKELKPKYFILENVASMPNRDRQIITDVFEIEPIMIDAALVSAQRRRRYFWTNIKGVVQPEDRGILLKDILLREYDEKLVVKASANLKHIDQTVPKQLSQIDGTKSIALLARHYASWRGKFVSIIQKARGYNKGGTHTEKCPTLTSNSFEQNNMLYEAGQIRKLDPVECERLQGLPDGYTASVSNTQRYKCLGNAFNVDVVAHILRAIDNPADVPQIYQLSLFNEVS